MKFSAPNELNDIVLFFICYLFPYISYIINHLMLCGFMLSVYNLSNTLKQKRSHGLNTLKLDAIRIRFPFR